MTKSEQAKKIIAPSILAADFGRLADETKRCEDAGADRIHIDVMDGHFVKNFTLGPRAVAAINGATELFLEVHIMIYNPFDYIERFVEAGADMIIFHVEATEDVADILQFIHTCNIKAGLALNPETSLSMALKYLGQCDQLLLMTVNPGFGGQPFIPEVLDKIQLAREQCQQNAIQLDIEVDGGITFDTAKQCTDAGANVLTSGTYLFKEKNMQKAIEQMRNL
ncbi:ribulose-phosphate 3-epimerase [Simkania negevensis]|uniref:Ribulose-phosphate 3-epimerase n=1 Tax=Simkania negevensis TaxID=83561 RepID=A0ABS3ARM1_9BACT|nr:ribulose-phosphate 3-epimerase [Simkania negevensis]